MRPRTRQMLVAAGAAVLAAPAAPAHAVPTGFVAHCPFSHRAADDPIVHPDEPGASHSHDFFGNRSTDAGSTARDLLIKPTTCEPSADRSAYWAPTVTYRHRAVRPIDARFYYAVTAADPAAVRPFPAGLRVIAGDPSARRVPARPVFGWTCTGSTVLDVTRIPRCRRRSDLVLRLRFPDCWDGRRRDSRDHRSHMAYGGGGRCPASHPLPVPQLQFEIRYRTRGGRGTRLSAGPTWTTHGDFMNAWDPGEFERRLRECVHTSLTCREDGEPYVPG